MVCLSRDYVSVDLCLCGFIDLKCSKWQYLMLHYHSFSFQYIERFLPYQFTRCVRLDSFSCNILQIFVSLLHMYIYIFFMFYETLLVPHMLCQ